MHVAVLGGVGVVASWSERLIVKEKLVVSFEVCPLLVGAFQIKMLLSWCTCAMHLAKGLVCPFSFPFQGIDLVVHALPRENGAPKRLAIFVESISNTSVFLSRCEGGTSRWEEHFDIEFHHRPLHVYVEVDSRDAATFSGRFSTSYLPQNAEQSSTNSLLAQLRSQHSPSPCECQEQQKTEREVCRSSRFPLRSIQILPMQNFGWGGGGIPA